MSLVGRKFRSLVLDISEDDNRGTILHPPGTLFTVVEVLHQENGLQMYAVTWDESYHALTGVKIPLKGQWTIWSEDEIKNKAEPVDGLPKPDGEE